MIAHSHILMHMRLHEIAQFNKVKSNNAQDCIVRHTIISPEVSRLGYYCQPMHTFEALSSTLFCADLARYRAVVLAYPMHWVEVWGRCKDKTARGYF